MSSSCNKQQPWRILVLSENLRLGIESNDNNESKQHRENLHWKLLSQQKDINKIKKHFPKIKNERTLSNEL